MPIQGDHLEPVYITTTEFSKYSIAFENKLVALYKIAYTEVDVGPHTSGAKWEEGTFFHGTGHCGCLRIRTSNPGNKPIQSREWCGNLHCATQGILNYGNLLTMCPSGGHFFSPCLQIPRRYAETKSPAATDRDAVFSNVMGHDVRDFLDLAASEYLILRRDEETLMYKRLTGLVLAGIQWTKSLK
ncbi:hypothetical protein BGZ65_010345 [Modicella reniformis]|uniref:Uncharacterized protein n=1 Tax=Modicella reniformis TaxID=1440133 RepID=A0A9P6SRZ2_9FUNG|nr:hypothetical protein BGZ65_010345 [Modicella reniformis]